MEIRDFRGSYIYMTDRFLIHNLLFRQTKITNNCSILLKLEINVFKRKEV